MLGFAALGEVALAETPGLVAVVRATDGHYWEGKKLRARLVVSAQERRDTVRIVASAKPLAEPIAPPPPCRLSIVATDRQDQPAIECSVHSPCHIAVNGAEASKDVVTIRCELYDKWSRFAEGDDDKVSIVPIQDDRGRLMGLRRMPQIRGEKILTVTRNARNQIESVHDGARTWSVVRDRGRITSFREEVA
jgi:hypothetical protein